MHSSNPIPLSIQSKKAIYYQNAKIYSKDIKEKSKKYNCCQKCQAVKEDMEDITKSQDIKEKKKRHKLSKLDKDAVK